MTSAFSKTRISRRIELLNIFERFFKDQSVGGIILLLCAIAALAFANIPQLNFIHDIWNQQIGIEIGSFNLRMTFGKWINDGLMTIFFFVVGLEIKREMSVGELSSAKKASLPIIAAFGGMIVPALLYTIFNYGSESQNGWGIPMATDIAFAIGVLSLLGKRVPVSLKVFLTALAIADDLGAIVVLAIFYPSHALHLDFLLFAAGIVALLFIFNQLNLNRPILYIIPGIFLWFFILNSGIHATISGVILAMTIPGKTRINEVRFYVRCKYLIDKFKKASNNEVMVLANPDQKEIIHSLHNNLKGINPLMNRFEHGLTKWVTFLIMPLFALSNAGVVFDSSMASSPIPPVATGIFFGLLFGKPIGIFFACFLASKLKIAQLPSGTNWIQLFSLGIIAGIGFTMSIFIDNLAFTDPKVIETGKAAILITSFLAALIGLIALHITTKSNINIKTIN